MSTKKEGGIGQRAVDEDEGDLSPIEAAKIEFPKDGKLTRKHMERVIKAGGSVLHHGAVIERVEDLPDEADLAEGDAEREAAVASGIDAQIAALAHQRSKLMSQSKPSGSEKKGDGK